MNELDIYLNEDLGEIGDITSDSIFTSEKIKAKIINKEKCVISGLTEIKKLFEKFDVNIEFLVKEGELIKPNTTVAKINGDAKSVLRIERLSLNILGKMSGISTITRELVNRCKKINPNVNVAATRKTTPGFRKFEKRAVIIGGGKPHRYGLYDAVMIKDNHIKIAGSLEKTIKKVKQKINDKTIEVEVENEKDAKTAAKLSVDIIMLDNFKPYEAKKLSEKIKKINKDILIESSGSINPENIEKYASFSDIISLGYITHSIKNIDFSLEVV